MFSSDLRFVIACASDVEGCERSEQTATTGAGRAKSEPRNVAPGRPNKQSRWQRDAEYRAFGLVAVHAYLAVVGLHDLLYDV
jgi:hypothetical protein